jgi:type VII secretion protein EccB
VPSRQDQLHSYQYSLQRVVAALVTHDPDPSRSPLRRAGTTALVSLLIAAIAVGAAGLYGLITGRNNVTVTDTSVVFQEKGTGARFVYLQSDHRLHPVLNYTSGLLLSTGQAPSLKSVSSEKLAAVQLGAPLGIPDAPDSLPAAGHDLLTDPWSVCTDNNGGGGTPQSTLLVGDKLTEGTIAATAAHGALLVNDPAQNVFLIYGNRRFQVPPGRETQTLSALGWDAQRPWPVSAAWINAVPAGPDLKAPAVPQSGGSSQFDGYRIGELVTDGSQVAVIMPDGQAGVTETQAKLLQLDLGKPVDIGADFAKLRGSATILSDANAANGLPPVVPALVDRPPTRLCMTLPVDKAGAGVRIDPNVPAGVAVAGVSTATASNHADLVYVPRGKGAVVVGAASASAPAGGGTVGIVTDTGRLYTLASRDLLPRLGYGDAKLQQIPAELLALLPRGPSLDPAQARRTDPQG